MVHLLLIWSEGQTGNEIAVDSRQAFAAVQYQFLAEICSLRQLWNGEISTSCSTLANLSINCRATYPGGLGSLIGVYLAIPRTGELYSLRCEAVYVAARRESKVQRRDGPLACSSMGERWWSYQTAITSHAQRPNLEGTGEVPHVMQSFPRWPACSRAIQQEG